MRRWTQTFTGSLLKWRTNSRTTSRKRIRDSTGGGFLTLAGWVAGCWRPNKCDGCCCGAGRAVCCGPLVPSLLIWAAGRVKGNIVFYGLFIKVVVSACGVRTYDDGARRADVTPYGTTT